ncbi:hypothetical protein Tco_1158807 [Tanacetum coccineum]
MYYPRFTIVIFDYFMAKDQAIPRRNKMFWHYAKDDFMFTTVRVISKHQDTQIYGAILPQHLTNQAMLESEAYMTHRAYATGEKTSKPKTTKKKADSEASPKTKTTQATKGKRIKYLAKGDKAAKKKQPAETSMDKGLTVLSDVALIEAEQLKLVIERRKTQTHNSHASGSGVDEGTDDIPGVLDDDEQISWKSSEEDNEDEVNVSEKDDDNDNNDDDDANQDDENPNAENPDDDDDDEQTDSDNDGDDFVHPKFSTHDDEARQDEVNEEATQETKDTHVILTALINPEGQQQSSSVSSGFISNMLNPRPDTGIDLIFNIEATSLVDVPVITIAEPPLVFATTLPPTPTPLIIHMQKTPFPIPTTAPSTSLQDLPNFGSLFGFNHRLKTLKNNFSEFKKTNQFAKAVSSIPCIVDAYLANKMNDATKTVVQLQSDRLRDEAQAENEDFLNKLEDNIKKKIKEHVKPKNLNKSKMTKMPLMKEKCIKA